MERRVGAPGARGSITDRSGTRRADARSDILYAWTGPARLVIFEGPFRRRANAGARKKPWTKPGTLIARASSVRRQRAATIEQRVQRVGVHGSCAAVTRQGRCVLRRPRFRVDGLGGRRVSRWDVASGVGAADAAMPGEGLEGPRLLPLSGSGISVPILKPGFGDETSRLRRRLLSLRNGLEITDRRERRFARGDAVLRGRLRRLRSRRALVELPDAMLGLDSSWSHRASSHARPVISSGTGRTNDYRGLGNHLLEASASRRPERASRSAQICRLR